MKDVIPSQLNPEDNKPQAVSRGMPRHKKLKTRMVDSGTSLPGNISIFEFNRRYRTKGPAFYAKQKEASRD